MLDQKYKRGVNKQLLSQIDNSCNCRLGSICEIVGGGTPDTLHAEYWGSTVEWFTPSEIGKAKYVSSSARKLSDIGLNNSSAKLLPIGTVLLTTRATLGEMSIAKRECCTNQGFQSLIPHQDRVLYRVLLYAAIFLETSSGLSIIPFRHQSMSIKVAPPVAKRLTDMIFSLSTEGFFIKKIDKTASLQAFIRSRRSLGPNMLLYIKTVNSCVS